MKYTALTIGPIIKSLGLAHKTRELWAASYFFSLFMEKVIDESNKTGTIILPYPDKQSLINTLGINQDDIKSAGIYPDHLILQSEKGLFDDLQKVVDNALIKIKNTFNFTCDVNDLKNYISAYIIQFEYTARTLKDKNGNSIQDNIIFQANEYLATCELQTKYTVEDKECFLNMFDEFIKSKFYKDKFKDGFPSLIEIATKGLDIQGINLNNDNEDDNTIWKELKEKNKGSFRTYHKYIAIVQADGDNISKIISSVAKNNKKLNILAFSKALSNFSLKAVEKITQYGGEPVYAGGDDLLFFAPISNTNNNIFDLIEDIDNLFDTYVKNHFSSVKPAPSMSYGVSITYYKFPMHEALNSVRKLLFEKAKKDPKNQVAFKVQKHSGQTFETVLKKPFDSKFTDMLQNPGGLEIHSVIYNLERHKNILKEIISDSTKMDNFFKNFYNEQEHNKKKNHDFLNNVKKLLFDTYKQTNDFEKTINQVYAQLRMVKFLNAKSDD